MHVTFCILQLSLRKQILAYLQQESQNTIVFLSIGYFPHF